MAEIEQAFADHPHDVAAILIEPIQGEGGDNHFRPQFFAELRRLADDNEALLVFDEVQTGFGATGRFWAYEHFGVVPDLVAFGKKSQVCGVMAGERVDEVPDNVFHKSSRINSTWGGNLVDMVRCTKYLEVIEHGSPGRARGAHGGAFLDGLRELAERHPAVLERPRPRPLRRLHAARPGGAQRRAPGSLGARPRHPAVVAALDPLSPLPDGDRGGDRPCARPARRRAGGAGRGGGGGGAGGPR